MAFVHEQLYMQDDMETVNFQSYAEGLTYHLRHTYRLGDNDISLSTDIEPLSLGLSSLIPCGLILNELITNALKYAVTDTRGLQISIALRRAADAASSTLSWVTTGLACPRAWTLCQSKVASE